MSDVKILRAARVRGSETAGAGYGREGRNGRGSETAGAGDGRGTRGSETAGAGEGHGSGSAVLDAAREYTRRGWRVVPLPPRAKGPVLAGWQGLRLGVEDVPRWFGASGEEGGANVGLLLGTPSGGLVDVDCDAPEAARAAALLLPPTGRVSGRASHPRSHFWYVVEGEGEPPRTAKFSWEGREDRGTQGAGAEEGDRGTQGAGVGHGRGSETAGAGGGGSKLPGGGAAEFTPRSPAPAALQPGSHHPDPAALQPGSPHATAHAGAMLVELRSTGCQTVAPPSMHPSGERVRWEAGGAGEPGRVSGAALRRAVAKVAACALLARHWPSQGMRDEAALALCGLLVRGGWPADEADEFARAVAQVAGDEEWPKRGKAAQSTRTLAAGGPVRGGPALAQRLSHDGERVVAKARAWLGLAEHNHHRCPPFVIDAHTLGGASMEGRGINGGAEGSIGGTTGPRYVRTLRGAFASDITEEPVEWLWRGRIPLGAITMLDGDPGRGKSQVTLDLAARVTTGRDMPDGTPGVDGGAIILAGEDSATTTVRPRLRAAGADLMRVWLPEGVGGEDLATGEVHDLPIQLPRDLDILEERIGELGVRLVVVDPLVMFIDPRLNAYRDQDMRVALTPLAKLAERTGAAFVLVRHLNKAGGGNALYRGGGSIGIIGAARSGLLIADDPDSPEHASEHTRVLAASKSNLGPPMPSLTFRIAQPQNAGDASHVEWLGASEHSADALLAARAARDAGEAAVSNVDEAAEWLRTVLAAGPMPAREVQRLARGQDYGDKTLRNARTRAGVAVRREGFGPTSAFVWELASGSPGPQLRSPAPLMPPPSIDAPPSIWAPMMTQGHQWETSASENATAATAATSPAPGDTCPATGGAHDYGMRRDAQYRRICLACDRTEGEAVEG